MQHSLIIAGRFHRCLWCWKRRSRVSGNTLSAWRLPLRGRRINSSFQLFSCSPSPLAVLLHVCAPSRQSRGEPVQTLLPGGKAFRPGETTSRSTFPEVVGSTVQLSGPRHTLSRPFLLWTRVSSWCPPPHPSITHAQ